MAKPREHRRSDTVERRAELDYRERLGDERVLHSRAGKVSFDAADKWLRQNDPKRGGGPSRYTADALVDVHPSNPTLPGFVYFVQSGDGGPIKIGLSCPQGWLTRLSHMQTGNPAELRLLRTVRGDKSVEAKLHKQFKDSRIRGEWFEPTPELLALATPVAAAA